MLPLSFIHPGCKKGHVNSNIRSSGQRTYGRPWEEVNFEVRVDALDIVDHAEDSSRGLIDVEVTERRVAADIVKAVDWCAWRYQAMVGGAVMYARPTRSREVRCAQRDSKVGQTSTAVSVSSCENVEVSIVLHPIAQG